MQRNLSREEIERRRGPSCPWEPDHAGAVKRAASPDNIRRWKRIQSTVEGRKFYWFARRLSEHILNSQLATDIFAHIADIRRPEIIRRPGKRRGPNKPDKDRSLLALYDARPGSKMSLARQLAGERWGTAEEIERRLTRLVTKRNKAAKQKPVVTE